MSRTASRTSQTAEIAQGRPPSAPTVVHPGPATDRRTLVAQKKPYLDVLFRWLDIALILAILPIWFPVLVAALIATYLHLGRPVLFRQTRMGLECNPFEIIKIRTMKFGIPAPEGALFAGWTYVNDPRVTPIGRFLRCHRIDELPQLFNVLKGEMSLVGPRPEPWDIAIALGKQIPNYHERHTVRPGLTGLCQLSPQYTDFGTVEKSSAKLVYDLQYIHKRSLILQVKILYQTLRIVFHCKGVA